MINGFYDTNHNIVFKTIKEKVIYYIYKYIYFCIIWKQLLKGGTTNSREVLLTRICLTQKPMLSTSSAKL